jgi:hypothetical protein
MMLDLALSPETAKLHDALKLVPFGETITYATLSALIGRNVTKEGNSKLSSARRIALRDDGAAFEVIRQVGLRRIPADEAPQIGTAARRKIRRASHRAVKGMVAVAQSSNGLSPDAQRKLSAEVSTLGLLAAIATDKATEKQATDGKVAPPALAGAAFLAHIGATGQ